MQTRSPHPTRSAVRALAPGIALFVTMLTLLAPARASRPDDGGAQAGGRLRLASDPQLSRGISLQIQARPLDEALKEITDQVDVRLEADRAIADDKITLFATDRPTGETLDRAAAALGYVWVRRKEGYQIQADLSRRQSEAADEKRLAEAALAQLPGLVRLYAEHLDRDPEELERMRNLLDRELATETDPGRRLQLRQQRRVAADLMEPGIRTFARALRDLTPEERDELATGRGLTTNVVAEDAAGQAIALEVRIRQAVVGDRAQIVFRTLEAMNTQGMRTAPNILEWRLSTLSTGQPGDDERRTTTDHRPPTTDHRPPTTDDPPPSTIIDPQSSIINLRIWLTVDEAGGGAPGRVEEALPAGVATPVIVARAGEGRVRIRSNTWVRPTAADFAKAIALASGVPVIADAYTRPVSVRPAVGEPLATVLDRFCERNGMRWQIEGGFLVLRSLTPALERRREVPERNVNRWLQSRTGATSPPALPETGREPVPPLGSATLSLGTLAEIAATLTDDQLEILEERWPLYTKYPESLSAVSGGVGLTVSRAGLRFFASLTEGQRELASRFGLPFGSLLPEQRRRFAAVFMEGGRGRGSLPPYPPGEGEALPEESAADPEEIAAGAFRLRTTEQTVRLSHVGSSHWEPVSCASGDGKLLAKVTTVEVGFHVAGQEAPRVVFRYQGAPEPLK